MGGGGREVAIIRTGIANLASVVAAFERLGARAEVTADPALVTRASHVMLPGVGAFGAGVAALDAAGLRAPLLQRIRADRPTIAICLGLQLLALASEETPGVAGLGILPTEVGRFAEAEDIKVPQLGWNRVDVVGGLRFLEPGYAYFANSYRLPADAALAGWEVATADHGGAFVAAIERGNVLGCQFHPELSGPWGMALLSRWLEAAA
jgi:imidazole glycerol phosphate synthase glutamine amidotransferase subunit